MRASLEDLAKVTYEQAGLGSPAPENAARSLCRLGDERERAHHRGLRGRSPQGSDRTMAALRHRRRACASQGARRLRLDLRARSRPWGEIGAAKALVRGG